MFVYILYYKTADDEKAPRTSCMRCHL